VRVTTSAEAYAHLLGLRPSDEVLEAVAAYALAIRREVRGVPTPRSGIRLEFQREVLARAVAVELERDRVRPHVEP
jgi:hypothetical protein